jgi:hypothetical protein
LATRRVSGRATGAVPGAPVHVRGRGLLGEGGSAVPRIKGINHNLAVYGWDLRDVLEYTAKMLEEKVLQPTDHLFKQIVENANERAALRVLKPAKDSDDRYLSPFGATARLGEEGTEESPGQGDGIETLIVLLGANNTLPSMLSLKVIWSEDGYDDLELKEQFTVRNLVHFKAELGLVVEQIRNMRVRHVILDTVPHGTIAPIARGVGSNVRRSSRYFPFYARPWISTEDFDVESDPHVTEQQARAIDSAIDQYNDAVAQAVEDAHNDGLDWYLFEVAGLLDRLAARRYIDDLQARPEWWRKYELPLELKALTPSPLPLLRRRTGGTHAGWALLSGRGAPNDHRLRDTGPGDDRRDEQHAGVKFYLGETARPSSPVPSGWTSGA